MTDTPHKVMLEALCVHEIFANFGYPREEAFLVINKPAPATVEVLVEIQHLNKTAAVRVGQIKFMTAEEVQDLWTSAVDWWNNLALEEKQAIYEDSRSFRMGVNIIVGFLSKGLGTTPEQIAIYDREVN